MELYNFLLPEYRMPHLSDLRKELKSLRKEHVKPVSRMKKGDVSSEIERLRALRAEVPPVAATLGAGAKKSRSEVETIKDAKAKEFPMKPSSAAAPAAKKAPAAPEKKKSKLDRLMEMMDGMSDSDGE